jgi:hypothetical protein
VDALEESKFQRSEHLTTIDDRSLTYMFQSGVLVLALACTTAPDFCSCAGPLTISPSG